MDRGRAPAAHPGRTDALTVGDLHLPLQIT